MAGIIKQSTNSGNSSNGRKESRKSDMFLNNASVVAKDGNAYTFTSKEIGPIGIMLSETNDKALSNRLYNKAKSHYDETGEQLEITLKVKVRIVQDEIEVPDIEF